MLSLVDLLSMVDELPGSESGALVLHSGGPQLGSIFAENNRVCWAAVAGQGRRLRDLLSRYSPRPLDPVALEQTFVSCREQGRPFGETLVERGLCAADTLRAALRRHTIESLVSLSRIEGLRAGWLPHRRGGYRATYTMSPVDLIAALGAESLADEADLASAQEGLDGVIGECGTGASFLRASSDPVIVHVHPQEPGSVKALLELGAWASAGLDVSGGFNHAVLARGIDEAKGPVTLGWRSSRRVVHAAVFDDRNAAARTCAELERRGYPAVLSTRAIASDVRLPRGRTTTMV